MKKTDPLSLFKKQIDNLAETLAPIANKKIAAPCFDTALFHHRSDSLGGYMQQIRDNFTQLITCVEAQRSQQVKFLATSKYGILFPTTGFRKPVVPMQTHDLSHPTPAIHPDTA